MSPSSAWALYWAHTKTLDETLDPPRHLLTECGL
jgi:hypothetical protein